MKKHLNLCRNCQYLAVYTAYDIQSSNLAGSQYDNNEEWMECGMGRWGKLIPASMFDSPNEWGKARCSDYQAEIDDESEEEVALKA